MQNSYNQWKKTVESVMQQVEKNQEKTKSKKRYQRTNEN